MSWVRIDDRCADHRKQLQAGPSASWLWLWSLCYASRNVTDGHVPDAALPRWSSKSDVARLIDAGLWDRADGGFVIHDYHDYNPSRSQVEHRRGKAAQRLKDWRISRGHAHGNADETLLHARFKNVHDSTCNAACNAAPVPVPVPVPVVPPHPLGGEKSTADDDAAGWLCRSYPAWYAEERNGATYRMQPTLDWHAALGLVETWPDRKHLERMARTFLRATNLPAAHANRSIVTFARQYASACDAQVRAGGAA